VVALVVTVQLPLLLGAAVVVAGRTAMGLLVGGLHCVEAHLITEVAVVKWGSFL
jgi:hypothetical protein